jgi:hypothetical protein
MHLQIQGLRTINPRRKQPFQIPHFLLSPHLDHFPRIMFRVASGKPKVTGDVPIPVFEYENRRFVDFDGEVVVCGIFADGMVYIGFLPS